MTSRSALFVLLASFAIACGNDGVHHLPDAPPTVIDGPADAAIDAGPDTVGLHVATSGTGSGTITSSPAGIACGTTCDATLLRGTVVTLTAAPAASSVFGGWGGACSGTMPTCDVTLADAANVTATFTLQTFKVSVVKSGAGTGTVMGDSLSCGTTCTTTVDYGTVITLTATPAALSSFAGWGGACSGMDACTVTVTAETAITANFALDDVTLFVTRGGNGTGTVTSSPTAIDCGTTCQHTFSAGQMTTLTAVPATGSTFMGWSGGGCTGTAPCTLTMTAATTVTATFTLKTFALGVARAGNGTGAVSSLPAGIACGTACTATFNYGTSVTLTPTASTGSTFTGWSGACTGTAACVVAIMQAANVTATFALDQLPLTVSKVGTGSGTVTGGAIACGATCMAQVNYGTVVTLAATAATGSTFAGWGGACTGTGACTVTMDMARSVTATFTLDTFTLDVAKTGNGTGTVSGGPISCGTTCTASLGYGSMVTLTATANAVDSTFAGWGGACTGTGACAVAMDMARSVTATFKLDTFVVTAATAGTGSGTVTGGTINCGTTCTETVDYNTVLTLTATPATGSTFTGWSGACTGTGTCVTTVTVAQTATATFTLNTFVVTAAKAGNGAGTITGGTINCGATCTETVNYNTVVTLTATPATGSTFTGWSGACTGTGTCVTTVTAAETATATFTLNTFVVTATKTGTGSGTVTGGTINCGATCTETVDYATVVTLTATPATGSTFTGWSGACTGTSTCVTTVTAAETATATFTANVTLTVAKTGTGAGTVTGTGINCGTTCSTSVPPNTVITLTATPSAVAATASTFTGWSGGGCTGTGTCTVTVASATTVTAGFTLKPNIIFITSTTQTGNLGGLAGADAICKARATAANLPGTYVAYLSTFTTTTPQTIINAPSRVGAASGWVRVDGKPVMNAITQFASGQATALFNAPSLMENGVDVTQTQFTSAWTGTSQVGAYAGACGSDVGAPWGSTVGTAWFGTSTNTNALVVSNDTESCQLGMRLYCLGIDRTAIAK